ncbi:MAG: hypothetical protein WBA99_06770, partial [Nodosilinea sp.]
MVDRSKPQASASRPRRPGKGTPPAPATSLIRKAERAKKRQLRKARKALIQYLVATLFGSSVIGVLLTLLGEPKLGLGAVVAIA